MPEPQSWPCVRYYADGRFVLVETPLDYAALDPGHADNPGGPFPPPDPSALRPLPTGETAREEVPELLDMVPPVYNTVLHEQARTMRAEGMTQQAIADHFGISRRTVRQWLEATDDAEPP